VPNLAEEDAAFGVNGVDDGFPCLDLVFGPYAGRVGEALSGVGNAGGFGNEEAAVGGSLGIVEDGVGLWKVVVGPLSGERCQDNSVRKIESSHLLGSDERVWVVGGRGSSHVVVKLNWIEFEFEVGRCSNGGTVINRREGTEKEEREE